MNNKLLLGMSLTAAFLAGSAQAMKYEGTVSTTALLTNQHTLTSNAVPAKKSVYLMKIKLSPQEKEKIVSYKPSKAKNLLKTTRSNLPEQVDAGMNGVPVLDQGKHGSCVTFANTAALDAMLGKGDSISQLCSLELGSYLANKGYYPSGWDGSNGAIVLNQFMQFGYATKDVEKTKKCGGLAEYPLNEPYNTGKPMPLDQYRPNSNDLSGKGYYWQAMLDFYQRMDKDPDHLFDGDKMLDQVKDVLASSVKNKSNPVRVTFGTFLPTDYCTSGGACGRYKAQDDTWALTKKIAEDPNPELGGHEMVIIGYDDNAVAVDEAGEQHKGLLTLRNSWGSDVGDHGNYYMSYDFFKKFVLEVQVIKFEATQEEN